MTKYNFLCIDIGTTSLKAALVSETGQVLSFLKINFNSKNIRTLSFEWMNAVKTALLKLNNESKEKVKIDAISISGNGPTIVTEDGQTFLWNEKIKIKKSIQKKIAPSLFLPRIFYFKNKFPESFKNKKILVNTCIYTKI